MTRQTQQHKNPPQPVAVSIVETEPFLEDVDKFLTKIEQRGLYLLLSEDPFAGEEEAQRNGLYRILYAKCMILYSISRDFKSIYLLCIGGENDGGDPPGSVIVAPPGHPDQDSKVKMLLNDLIKGGVIAIGKRAVDAALDYISGK